VTRGVGYAAGAGALPGPRRARSSCILAEGAGAPALAALLPCQPRVGPASAVSLLPSARLPASSCAARVLIL